MASVFVSYAREDAQKARVISRALEDALFDVWFDERLHSGTEFSQEIEEALRSAGAVVVLWSKASIQSAWVRDEAAEGRDTGRLVPVVLDECRAPMGFRQIHTTDLSRWSGRGHPKQIAELVEAVTLKVGGTSAARPRPISPPFSRRSIVWTGAAVILALIAATAFILLSRVNNAPNAPLSVALLPFDASAQEARQLAPATHDAVAQALSQSPFTLSLVDSASKVTKADFLMRGQLNATAGKASADIQMEDVASHAMIFSAHVDASGTDISNLPERVGAQIAAQLSWTAPLLAIDRRHPSDPAITAALLKQVSLFNDPGVLEQYERTRRLAGEAPDSAIAQLSFAMNTAFALGAIPRQERPNALDAARVASDSAQKLAPDFGDVFIPWCILRSEQRRIQCEDRLRMGIRTDPDAPFANVFLSSLLMDVGRDEEAEELARAALAHDQYVPSKIAQALEMLEATGRTDEAADLNSKSQRWWPLNQLITHQRDEGIAQRGDVAAAANIQAQVGQGTQANEEDFAPLAAAARTSSVDGVRKTCSETTPSGLKQIFCMLTLARLGDLDSAFHFADQIYPSRRGRSASDEQRIWLDDPNPASTAFLVSSGAAPMRRDPRYLQLAERVGLIEYWSSGRLPDFCTRSRPEPICAHFHPH